MIPISYMMYNTYKFTKAKALKVVLNNITCCLQQTTPQQSGFAHFIKAHTLALYHIHLRLHRLHDPSHYSLFSSSFGLIHFKTFCNCPKHGNDLSEIHWPLSLGAKFNGDNLELRETKLVQLDLSISFGSCFKFQFLILLSLSHSLSNPTLVSASTKLTCLKLN